MTNEQEPREVELERLRKLERAVWHMLDDAGERCDLRETAEMDPDSTLLEVYKDRLEAVNDLLPEELPGMYTHEE